MERRSDLCEKLIDLSQKHLKPVYSDKLELEVRDVSGNSNPVYLVNVKDCADENNKIIIKFFQSFASNCKNENLVQSIADQQKYCPSMIETDNETYRVEEYYHSQNANCEDLRDRDFLEKLTRIICDFNYDPKFHN